MRPFKVHVTRLPHHDAPDRSREWSVGVMDLTEEEARLLERLLYEGFNSVRQVAAEQETRRRMAAVAGPPPVTFTIAERDRLVRQLDGPERDEALRRLLGERINAATELRDKIVGADITGLTKPKPKPIDPSEPQQGNRFSGLDIE